MERYIDSRTYLALGLDLDGTTAGDRGADCEEREQNRRVSANCPQFSVGHYGVTQESISMQYE